jgi:hypothetical protein
VHFCAFLCHFVPKNRVQSRFKKSKTHRPDGFFFHFIGEADIGTAIWHFAHFRDNS